MAKNEYIAAILNFFLLGLGTVYNGKRVIFGILMTVAAVIATYVEFQIQALDTTLYWLQFASFFLLVTACAIDGYNEAKSL